MKKIYFSAIALIFGATFTINAQNTAFENKSFENWTSGALDNWELGLPSDGVLDIATPITQETALTPIPDGASYIRLETFDVTGTTDTNFVNGTNGAEASQIFSSTDKISSFIFDVQYATVGTDSAVVSVLAVNSSFSPVAQGYVLLGGTTTGWEKDTINLTFTGTPAYYLVSVASSESAVFGNQAGVQAPQKGSWLAVDNFVTGAVLIDAPNVSNVIASDIADNNNGSDLKVTFDVPADESNILNYYLTVFASPYSGNNLVNKEPFLLDGFEITPNGNSQTHTFSATDVYWDAVGGYFVDELIEENIELIVTVYVKGKTGYESVLSTSNKITLTSSGTTSLVDYSNSVNVYPNPAADFVNFEIDGLENGTITINSITGQTVVTSSIDKGAEKVNVNHLNNGVYIYTVRNSNGETVKTNKLVIRK